MLRNIIVACIVLLIGSSISFAGSDVNFKSGKWEITTKMKMEGGMDMPSHKSTQCMTNDDIVPQNTQPGQECVVTKTKKTGNTITWSMECSGAQGNMKGIGTITYKGDTFDGEMVMSMPMANMKLTSKMTGRRIGKCD